MEGNHLRLVSIVIPAKDEEQNLRLLLADLNAVVASLSDYQFEVIVVDDRSADGTGRAAQEAGARVVRNEGRRSGKGIALRQGLAAARGDYLVTMDADYSHRPEELPQFLLALDEGAGLVVGSRIYGGSDEYTRVRALGNILLTAAFGLFHGRYLSDALNGYKALRREVFTDFTYTSTDFEIEIELLVSCLRKGYTIVEVRSHERTRAHGQAKSRVIRHGTRFLVRTVREWLVDRLDYGRPRRA